ncbi:MAG: DUF1957 domain-containing protein [Chloroflexi bacterium]|nr:DUF1957 domain-containing protein [Chloroflexota bacterium]
MAANGTKHGAFTFVLHSHLPYCRSAGRWPHGEEWLHEGIVECYLPLLVALYDLRDEGVPFRLTLGLTPVLVEQLADPLVQAHAEEYLRELIRRARSDVHRFEREGSQQRVHLARLQWEWFSHLGEAYHNRFGGDLVGAFRRLQDEEHLEILTSAATHGYLPLLERDSSVYSQLRTGRDSYLRHFGRAPRAIWLPECAYRPAYYTEGPQGQRYVKPGLEEYLEDLGITGFFVETHAIEGGAPVGKALGGVIGPYGEVPKRYVMPAPNYTEPTHRTTYQPYRAQRAQAAAFGRNNPTSMQVWSQDWGYPGDYHYREFHKRDGVSGLRYWRVTGARVELGHKELYEPARATEQMRGHSQHFAGLVENLLEGYYREYGKPGIICAAYDSELFGHWWFEGITWIQEVLRRLAASPVVELVTASGYLERHPPEDVLAIPESSWGQAGNHFTWMNVDTEWLWPAIHDAERRMEDLVERYPEATGDLALLLNQAARELLLLQSSDWPFLITTGQAKEYAIQRFEGHAERFNHLAEAALRGAPGPQAMALYREFYETDNVFPFIDYRVFQEREGRPSSL